MEWRGASLFRSFLNEEYRINLLGLFQMLPYLVLNAMIQSLQTMASLCSQILRGETKLVLWLPTDVIMDLNCGGTHQGRYYTQNSVTYK